MPHSDNLYTADSEADADAESFTDELSPTDGYFNPRSIPETLVPDPTPNLDRKTTEDKVLIPGPGRGLGRDTPASVGGSTRTAASAPQAHQPHTSTINTYASPQRSDDTPLPTPLAMFDTTAPISPLRNTTPFSPRSNASSSLRSPHRSALSENTPLMGAPPPAYSASATTSAPSPPQNDRAYNTFEQTGAEQGYYPPQQPESMGQPEYVREERTPLYKYPPKRRSICTLCGIVSREVVKQVLFAALVLVVFISILLSTLNVTLTSGDRHKGNPSVGGRGPYCSYASYDKPLDIIEYDIGTGKDLYIIQTVHEGDLDRPENEEHIQTSGAIRIQRLPKDSDLGAHFSFDIRTSDPSLDIIHNWDSSSRTFRLSTPKHASLKLPGPHCISVEINAWLPEDADLGSLGVEAVTLQLHVLDDLKVNLSGASVFSTISGSIQFPKFVKPGSQVPITDGYTNQTSKLYVKPDYSFASRSIEIETTSGSISGLYPLYDLLSFKTISGSVQVGVIPQGIDEARPAPASLAVKSYSSSINVHLPILGAGGRRYTPPLRDYITNVESTSGRISGSYYQGTHGLYRSLSGSIQLSILPIFGNIDTNSELDTRSESGSTNVNLLEPEFLIEGASQPYKRPRKPSPYRPIGDGDPYLLLPPKQSGEMFDGNAASSDENPDESQKIRNLHSTHSSTSGAITLKYPQQWEGIISAKVVSGSISIAGNGVKLIRENNGWGSKTVVARKGVEREGQGSSVELSNISGGLKFTI
ncbi:hypothetical protein B0O99DRAFT_744962 [Bisporella sp. PMI_857]|nr:hypothetical protein B0O99DRAFT_744962 [Bisporella sp. PMI_857]